MTARDLARVLYNLLLWPLAWLVRLLAPRSPRRWVFAGCGGTRFADNAAWLFLWASVERPDLRPVWVTRDRAIARRLRAAGLAATLEWTPRGLWLAARAGVAVLSHGPGDLYYPAISRAFVANLWHGLPIKHIMLDHPADRVKLRPANRLGRLVQQVQRPGLLGGPDFLFAMTQAGRERMQRASGLPPERTSAAGSPRLQALTAAAPRWPFPEDVAEVGALRGQRRLMVLFLPTWGTDAETRQALLGQGMVGWLAAHDAVLVLKTHPNDPVMAERPEWDGRIRVARRTLDAMLLMAEADILVTDVSSALVDMLAARKPALVVRTAWGRENRDSYQSAESFLSTPAARDETGLCRLLDKAVALRRLGRSNASVEAAMWLDLEPEAACPRVIAAIEGAARQGRGRGRRPGRPAP